jgi:hypothetical protein
MWCGYREIKVCGLIKDLKVGPTAYSDIFVLMDVTVIDVPNAWGMLLSENWATCLGGNIRMDLSHATIPTCEGTYVTLHREPTMRYQVEYQ